MDLEDYKLFFDINGKSRHQGESAGKGYNENNYGFGVTGAKEKEGLVKLLTTGGYKNSYNDPSFYAGGGLAKRFQAGDYYADIGGVAGGVTGYDKTLSPLAAFLLSLGKKDTARINMMLAPPSEDSPSLIMMNLGIPFK